MEKSNWANRISRSCKAVMLAVTFIVLPLIVTGCFARASGMNPGSSTNESSGNVLAQVEEKPLTARESFELSLATARSWKRDAVLVSATATIPWPSERLNEGKTTWAFYYASPSSSGESITYVVAVNQGRAEGIRQPRTGSQAKPVEIGSWTVDSPSAMESFLANGGRAALGKLKTADVNIRLVAGTPGDEPVWVISVFGDGAAPYLVQVGAARGEIKGGQTG